MLRVGTTGIGAPASAPIPSGDRPAVVTPPGAASCPVRWPGRADAGRSS